MNRILSKVAALSLVAASMTVPAHAQALLEAEAAGAIVSDFGPTALSVSNANAGFAASTTRTFTEASGSGTGSFLSPIVNGRANGLSNYEVTNIVDAAPVTLTWRVVGARTSLGNENVQLSVQIGMNSFVNHFFVYEATWGIGYAKGPEEFGGFAGNETGGFGGGGGGVLDGFVLNAPTSWNGIGTVFPMLTLPMNNLMSGEFRQTVTVGLAGTVDATLSMELLSATVPNASYLIGPAFITLDSGQQIPISAIPEPGTWALIAALAVLACALARRLR